MNPRTMRCTVCSISWPFKPLFQPCPVCGETTYPMFTNFMEEPLTDQEAVAECASRGAENPFTRKTKRLHMPALNPEAAVAHLHEDLDRWAERAPSWLKR